MIENRKKIALLIETSNSYARGLLHGIRDYTRIHKSLSIYLGEHSRGNPDPLWLKDWPGDGVIARIENKKIAEAVIKSGLPAVDVSAGRYIPDIPWVETNDEIISKLAAEHLTGCGLKNFAYCGDPYFNWSKWRNQHFKRIINDLGFKCYEYKLNSHGDSRLGLLEEQEKISNWLISLPKPIGVFACYDICGQQLIEACRSVDIIVPDEVAVLGFDNDELLCDLSDPPLSSIIPNTHKTGYKAAELLDRIIDGEKISGEKFLIEPIGITNRQSTDILAIKDEYVVKAIKYIHNNLDKDIVVQDLLKGIPLSRRVFEKRFIKILNRSPYEEIIRLKLMKVKQLLLETDLPLHKIAEKVGFKYIEYLSSLFHKKVGLPPSHYRVKYKYKDFN